MAKMVVGSIGTERAPRTVFEHNLRREFFPKQVTDRGITHQIIVTTYTAAPYDRYIRLERGGNTGQEIVDAAGWFV
jgi:hypothetical protein